LALWRTEDACLVADGDVLTVTVAVPYHRVKPTLRTRVPPPLPPTVEELLLQRRSEQEHAAAAHRARHGDGGWHVNPVAARVDVDALLSRGQDSRMSDAPTGFWG
jgi:hypothetical protein